MPVLLRISVPHKLKGKWDKKLHSKHESRGNYFTTALIRWIYSNLQVTTSEQGTWHSAPSDQDELCIVNGHGVAKKRGT